MTTEEKAKAYDEALKLARKIHSGKGVDAAAGWSTLETIFPQLRESEDERVIRTLYYLVRDHDWLNGATKGEALAYLEKQKEQKHPNGCFTCDEYKKGYEEGRRNGFTAGYNKAMKEVEQKEQKPWKVGANAYFTPEQKPAWSEEDEKMIDTIVSVLGQYIDYKAVSGTGTGYATPRYSKEIDWLKSLRPSWKPSGEQMRMLKCTIDYYDSHAPKELVSLYEQLLKL